MESNINKLLYKQQTPILGDKIASTNAQISTIALIVPEEDIPYLEINKLNTIIFGDKVALTNAQK